jgi:imidazolonepropionase-like amidohydrolase
MKTLAPALRIARGLVPAAALALSASVAAPPSASAQTLAVRGGTLHTLAGEPSVGTLIAVDGVITAVGPDVEVPEGATVIDATGLHVYPGLFDAGSELGLTEIGSVDVTNDAREQGLFNPHLRTLTAIHPASEHIPVARSNGITHALALPGAAAGGIAGQASLVKLAGWTVEEMLVEPGAAMMVIWPTKGRGFGRFGGFGGAGGGGGQDPEERYREGTQRLTDWFAAARNYGQAHQGGPVDRDLKLEALQAVLDREMPVLVQANGAEEIEDAVNWAREQNVRLVLAGGTSADEVAELLAANDVGVILGPTQRTPQGRDAAYDEPYALPGKLHAAGVQVAFATYNSADSRVLPYEAAQAVAFGLPRDVALRAVTSTAAELLGLGDRLGTLEAGKLANLIVTDGDPLVIQTQVRHLVVGGQEVSTDNRHRRLYETYRARPRPGGR